MFHYYSYYSVRNKYFIIIILYCRNISLLLFCTVYIFHSSFSILYISFFFFCTLYIFHYYSVLYKYFILPLLLLYKCLIRLLLYFINISLLFFFYKDFILLLLYFINMLFLLFWTLSIFHYYYSVLYKYVTVTILHGARCANPPAS